MAECHVAFLPMKASGHMIPMVDMAVVMASRGVKTTIITDQSSAHRFSKAVEQTINYDHQITFHIFEYKAAPVNILDSILGPQETVEQFLQESRPNCIISDVFYAWTTKVAAKFDIPRIIFDPSGFFTKCVEEMMALYEPEKSVSSDSEPFIVPHLPHEITLTRKEITPKFEASEFVQKLLSDASEANLTSYGTIVNSFYELEPEYVCHYREVVKRRAWHIGMVSLCCKNTHNKVGRGGKSDIDEHEISKWLDSKTANSVVYISFGTMVKVVSSQVYEIAMGLEASNQDFIWVIKKGEEISLPQGFEERMKEKGKGLIVKGWAPQLLILDHVSVGGFITHAGCNSMFEGICGGVAMVTWPVNADMFYNAKLVMDVLKIGVSIGDGEWRSDPIIEGVKRDSIQKALGRIMSPEEGGKMRRRAQILKQNAKAAVKEGGSSYLELTNFIDEMKAIKSKAGLIMKNPTKSESDSKLPSMQCT